MLKNFFVLLLLLIHPYLASEEETLEKKSRKSRLLLITGCGRSGTTFITKFLNLNGVKVAHETDAPDGMVSWYLAVESDEAICCPGSNRFKFKHIFHQVRDPLKTIASMSQEPVLAWNYVCSFIPQVKMTQTGMVRAAKYWYYWNLRAEMKSEWTYRIEDIDAVVKKMSHKLGIKLDPALLAKVPRDTNTRHYNVTCTWAKLRKILRPSMYERIVSMAKRYGYPVED